MTWELVLKIQETSEIAILDSQRASLVMLSKEVTELILKFKDSTIYKNYGSRTQQRLVRFWLEKESKSLKLTECELRHIQAFINQKYAIETNSAKNLCMKLIK